MLTSRSAIFSNRLTLNYFACVLHLFGIDGLSRLPLTKTKWRTCNMRCVAKQISIIFYSLYLFNILGHLHQYVTLITPINFNLLHFIQNTRRTFPKTSEKFKWDDVRFVVSGYTCGKNSTSVTSLFPKLTTNFTLVYVKIRTKNMSSIFNGLNQKLALLSVTGLAAILGLNSFRGFIHHSKIVL